MSFGYISLASGNRTEKELDFRIIEVAKRKHLKDTDMRD
jgi:hypothetical protein